MADPTKSETEIATQSTQASSSNKATVREASIKGKSNSPQNNTENSDMVSIPKAEYERLLFISQTAKDVIRDLVTRVDSTIHVQKGQLSQCLNQTVRAHNILADLEAIKDSILSGGKV